MKQFSFWCLFFSNFLKFLAPLFSKSCVRYWSHHFIFTRQAGWLLNSVFIKYSRLTNIQLTTIAPIWLRLKLHWWLCISWLNCRCISLFVWIFWRCRHPTAVTPRPRTSINKTAIPIRTVCTIQYCRIFDSLHADMLLLVILHYQHSSFTIADWLEHNWGLGDSVPSPYKRSVLLTRSPVEWQRITSHGPV